METTLYNQKGESAGTISVSEKVFGLPWNADLVHQVVVSMQSNARNPVAHTKNRGEVRGGGKKPWKQKGTGQARHGSTRSPIWVGGGVAHGPRNEKNYDRKVNKKMKTKALFTILSQKMKDGEVVFLDALALSLPKTKEAVNIVSHFNKIPALKGVLDRKNALVIAVPSKEESIARSFRNIGNIALEETRNVNPVSLLSYKRIVFVSPEETMRIFESKLPVAVEKKAHVKTKTSQTKKVTKNK